MSIRSFLYPGFFKLGKDDSLIFQEEKLKDLKKFEWIAVTTDSQVHRKGENVFLLIASTLRGQKVKLEIFQHERLVFPEKQIELSKAGLAVHQLEGLKDGEYTVKISYQDLTKDLSASHQFTIAPYTRSVIDAAVSKYSLDKGKLDFEMTVTHLISGLYEGKAKVSLLSGSRVVWEQEEALILHGGYKNKLDVSSYSGPFTIEIVTPDGNTSSVFLPNTGVSERQKEQISSFGKSYFEACLHPFAGSQAIRGLHVGPGKQANTSLILKSAIGKKDSLKATEQLPEVKIVIVNPETGKHEVHSFKNVRKNQTLGFSVTKPYAIVLAGAVREKGKAEKKEKELFEAGAFVFYPVELKGEIQVAEKAAPGQEISIVVSSPRNKSAEGIIVVRDKRVEHRCLGPKIAATLFEKIEKDAFLVVYRSLLRDLRHLVGFLGGELGPQYRKLRSGLTGLFGDISYFMSPPRGMVERGVKGLEGFHVETASGVTEEALSDLDFNTLMAQITPAREIEIHVIHVEHFKLSGGKKSFDIKLGDQIGEVETIVYLLSGHDHLTLTKTTEVTKDAYVEADIPAFVDKNDKIQVSVGYRLPGEEKANLFIGADRHLVQGSGSLPIEVTGKTGELLIDLTPEHFSPDKLVKKVEPLGIQTVTQSEITILKPGETVSGKVFVYASPLEMQKNVVEALCGYPYGCAEQTSAGLYGLGMAYLAFSRGLIAGGNGDGYDLSKIKDQIYAGTNRLKTVYGKFASSGRWGLWENSSPSTHVSMQVARNLSPYYALVMDFPELTEIVVRTKEKLTEDAVRNNELLVFGPEFAEDKIDSPEAAAATILWGHPDERYIALDYLKSTYQKELIGVSWQSQRSWAGRMEITAKVGAALFKANDPLAYEAFGFLSDKLENGRFYSTTDTSALILLLSQISSNGLKGKPKVKIDGQEKVVDGVIFGKKVTAINQPVMVRVDKEKRISLLDIKPGLQFEYALLHNEEIKLGDRVTLRVIPKEKTRCPIVKVIISGVLSFLEGKVNLQIVEKPVIGEFLELPLLAIRRGQGTLHIVVTDMYDPEKIGIMHHPISVS